MRLQWVAWGMTVLLLFVFVLFSAADVRAADDAEPADIVLQFADPALENAIRGRLAQSDWPLSASNAHFVDRLYVEWPDEDDRISSLDGMEGLTELLYVILTGHDIENVTPLGDIANLVSLNLTENRVVDISALSGLFQLDTLDLTRNRINDLSAVAGMDNLQYLYVAENDIRDLSPLAHAKRLERLVVHRNDVRDIAALAELPALRQVTLYGNHALNLCHGTPERKIVDDLIAAGVEVLYDERAAGDEPCPDVANVPPMQIKKHLGDATETIVVQSGQMARLNPDGTRVLAMCRGTAQTVTFINDGTGVYWTGPLQQFVGDLNQFTAIHLLPDDPHVRYAVNVRVSEEGEETVAGYAARHYRVEWQPHPDEGGDAASWKPLQELWIASGVTDELAFSGCQDVVAYLEILQLFQSAFSLQRYYGLGQSMEYAQAAMSGFPMKVKMYGFDDEAVATFEVAAISHEAAVGDAFSISKGLAEVRSATEVFD